MRRRGEVWYGERERRGVERDGGVPKAMLVVVVVMAVAMMMMVVWDGTGESDKFLESGRR